MRNKITSHQNEHNNVLTINQLNKMPKSVYEIIVLFYILGTIFV